MYQIYALKKLRPAIWQVPAVLILLICTGVTALAQNATTAKIYGTVRSEKGEAIAGASLLNSDNILMAKTDTLGRFALSASPGSTLKVSVMGYSTLETKAITGEMRLVLKEKPVNLAAVEITVSNGYQDIPKERATGSFSQIDNQLFNEQISTSVLSRLEAIGNGLTADRKTNSPGLMIRGLSTIIGVKGPLIVVDNFPYEGDINNINPNDVENITLLKDAAAASIWGTRAGNGVIVITTKKGRFNQPINIDFTSNLTVIDKPDLGYLKQMSSSDYIDVEQMLYSKGFYTSQINSTARPAVTPVVELLMKKTAGTLSAAETDARINALRIYDVRDDFNKYLYQAGTNQQYSLTIRGGSNSMAWTLSSGYDRNRDVLDAGYNRLNVRFTNTLNVAKNIQLTAGLYYTQSKSVSGKPAFGSVSATGGNIPPYTRFADDDGNSLPVIKNYRQSYIETAGAGKLLDWNYYPLEDYKHAVNTTDLQDINANFGLNYKLLKGLSADIKYQYERQQSEGRNLQDVDSYFTRNLINMYSQINASTGIVTYRVPVGGILDISNSKLVSQNVRGQLNFSREIGDHYINAIAGSEIRNARSTGNSFRNYGYDPDILKYANVDYANTYPSFVNGASSFIANNTGYSQNTNRFVSLYANAAYTYMGKYTLSGSGRRDASNLFGVNTNDRWTPLWSAGASWDISKENFYKLGFLPELKLRLTWGYSGSIDQSRSAVSTISYGATSAYTQGPTAFVSRFANPELRWERAGMLNLGVDFGSKNKRISGSIEFYQKKGKDLFGISLLDYTTGAGSSIVKNVASMSGKGLDVDLQTLNVNREVKWTSRINFSTYSDKITKYYLPSYQASIFVGSTTPNVTGLEGKPVYSIYSYKWAGLDPQTGDPRGYVNGQISKDYNFITGSSNTIDNLTYHGPALPTVFGSTGQTISYKNFSATAAVIFKLGYYFKRSGLSYNAIYSRTAHYEYAQRWQKPGDEAITNVPSLIYPNSTARDALYTSSEVNIEKGDHVRLQYISAAYEFKRSNIKSLPFERIQLGINMANLGLLWKANKVDLDPDYPSLPPSKNVSISLKASL